MKRLDEVLQGTIEEMRKRRKQLVAYRNKCYNDGYKEDEALQAQDDIYRIDERIGEMI